MSKPLHMPLSDAVFISEFAAYARGRGAAAYRFMDNTNCACAQFLRDTGRAANPWVGGFGWNGDGIPHLEPNRIPARISSALQDDNRTFSALADRLEQLIADAPKVISL